MGTTDDPADLRVQGSLVVFRIYGIREPYLAGRREGDGDHVHQWSDLPTAGDTTELRIGELPTDFLTARDEARASFLLRYGDSSQWRNADDPIAARDLVGDRYVSERAQSKPEEKVGAWVSIRVERPVPIPSQESGRYLWGPDYTTTETMATAFSRAVGPHIDAIAASVETATGMAFTRTLAVNDEPFFIAPGHAAFTRSIERAQPFHITLGVAWEDFPIEAAVEAVDQMKWLPSGIRERIATAHHWLTMSLKESDDEMKAFLFAFVGIEGLVQGLTKDVRPIVVDNVRHIGGHTLPIDQLLWPSDADSEPYRSVIFSFALVAAALAPHTAVADVDHFRLLNKQRQRIAHGKDQDLAGFSVEECRTLLRTYVGHALRYSWTFDT